MERAKQVTVGELNSIVGVSPGGSVLLGVQTGGGGSRAGNAGAAPLWSEALPLCTDGVDGSGVLSKVKRSLGLSACVGITSAPTRGAWGR